MGSEQSTLVGPLEQRKQGMGDLPEDCIAMIISRLNPPEICEFAKLNRAFRSASMADFVWEDKIPENYEFIVSKLFDGSHKRISKRDIYSLLSKAVRFDAGTKEIWLEKSGKMCMAISWKGMKITGIDDCRYWTHIPTQQSRFNAIAYLKKVWWLEVGGEVEFKFPTGKYSLLFKLQLGKASKIFGSRIYNLEQVHGWGIKPVKFQLSTSNDQHTMTQCYLNEVESWVCYHVGDFDVDCNQKHVDLPLKIKFSMTQIDCTHTKGGLCLDSVIICPCELTDDLKNTMCL